MRLLTIFSTASLGLILTMATLAYSQEPKGEAKPAQPHPGAAAPHAQPAPAAAPRPQADPAARPSAPTPHEAKPPEPRPHSAPPKTATRTQAEPAAHPAVEAPHEGKPPGPRPQEHPVAHPSQEPEHQEESSTSKAHPSHSQHRTEASDPVPTARPQPGARPAAEPPRTAERRPPAPNPEQQQEWQRRRVENWQAAHHSWQQRGGYRGYRVPEERYQAYYGPPHAFRIYEYPVTFVNSYPRFQYGGQWVQLLDPYPNYWAPDWFYTDPVYLEYLNDGYYLINTRDPGVPLAVELY